MRYLSRISIYRSVLLSRTGTDWRVRLKTTHQIKGVIKLLNNRFINLTRMLSVNTSCQEINVSVGSSMYLCVMKN